MRVIEFSIPRPGSGRLRASTPRYGSILLTSTMVRSHDRGLSLSWSACVLGRWIDRTYYQSVLAFNAEDFIVGRVPRDMFMRAHLGAADVAIQDYINLWGAR